MPTTAPDTNSDVGIDETGVAPIDVSQSEEDDVADGALLLFFGIIAVLLGALYLVSRGGEDALAAEVQIEKMWDEQEAGRFVGGRVRTCRCHRLSRPRTKRNDQAKSHSGPVAVSVA